MAAPNYVFKKTLQFRRAFSALSPAEKTLAEKAFKVFKANPFDPSLKPHKINRLSSLHKRTVHSISIAADLRVVFIIKENIVFSLDIGSHDIYK